MVAVVIRSLITVVFGLLVEIMCRVPNILREDSLLQQKTILLHLIWIRYIEARIMTEHVTRPRLKILMKIWKVGKHRNWKVAFDAAKH